MQNSRPGKFHMDTNTLENALKFGRYIDTNVINVSGGEPSEHPEFMPMMEKIFDSCKGMVIMLATNGEWLLNKKKGNDIAALLSRNPNFFVQITSVKKLYPAYDKIKNAFNDWKMKYSYNDRVVFVEKLDTMKCLGRAKGVSMFEMKSDEYGHASSCANAMTACKQMKRPRQWGEIEQFGLLCKPFIDFKGNVHMGESIFCKGIGNVNKDEPDKIWENMRSFKPCQKCRDFKRMLVTPNQKHGIARELLGYDWNPIRNIDWDAYRKSVEADLANNKLWALGGDCELYKSAIDEDLEDLELLDKKDYGSVYNRYYNCSAFINFVKLKQWDSEEEPNQGHLKEKGIDG